MTRSASLRPGSFELRLYLHAFAGRGFFYIPILVLHLQDRLEEAEVAQANAVTLSVIALFGVGIAVAEYPSGVFADWAGRTRALVLGSLLYMGGVAALWWPGPLWLLALSQLVIGIGSAFRSGADTALLYSHLARAGTPERYPGALARLRFANLAGISLSALAGGYLYAWSPASVFWVTIVVVGLGILPLLGLPDLREGPSHGHYWAVMRASLSEFRANAPAQVLVLLGGTGATYFVFCYWAVQSYGVAVQASPVILGQLTLLVALLQAATMPLSSWLARRRDHFTRLFASLLLGVGAAFGIVSLATRVGLPPVGAGALVLAAGGAPLFRNLVNVRLQPLVPDGIRASMVSLETWLHALYYALFFPLAGWLLDATGQADGWAWIGAVVLVTSLPILALSRARRL